MNPEPDSSSNQAFYLPDHSSVEELAAIAELLQSTSGPDRALDLRLSIALLCLKMHVAGVLTYFLKSRTEFPYAVLEDHSPHAKADPNVKMVGYWTPEGLWLAADELVVPYTASVDAAFELAEACGEDPELVLTAAFSVELKEPAAVFTSDLARRILIACLNRLIIRAGLKESDLDDT